MNKYSTSHNRRYLLSIDKNMKVSIVANRGTKWWAWTLTCALSGMAHLPQLKAETTTVKPLGQITEHLRINGSLRGRYEVYDFFQPEAINNNNDYDFWALRGRLGLQFNSKHVDAEVQGEYSSLYGLPNNAFAIPGGPLALGALYYAENGGKSVDDLHLKQAYLNIKLAALGLPGLSLKLGRFELHDGLEYKTGETKFDLLKVTRVSQRLIGTFDFAHASRNFDGIALNYDQADYNLNISATRPTQGGFNLDAQKQIGDIDLVYAALTSKKDALLPGTEARLFYLYYGDRRNVQVVDNRTASQRPRLDQHDLAIHTLGMHWLTVHKFGTGIADALIWGAYQFGDWSDQRHRAYAFDIEAGYQWPELPLKPWLRAGYFHGSGDSDATDNKHGTFFQVLPTVRLYAKFPYFNAMNINDTFVQLLLAPTANTRLGIDFHHLTLDKRSDLFYAGAGANSRSGSFGFLGRPANGNGGIGQLVDISFTHTINSQLSWSAYYAHAFGGSYIDNFYHNKSNADFAFVELNVTF